MQESYIKVSQDSVMGMQDQGSALAPLPEGYANPVSRFVLRELSVVIALCHADSPGAVDVLKCCQHAQFCVC